MSGILLAVVVSVGACLVLYLLTRRRPARARTLRELQAELRRLTHDADVAERLIERMRKRHPDASESALVRLAIRELRADRRR